MSANTLEKYFKELPSEPERVIPLIFDELLKIAKSSGLSLLRCDNDPKQISLGFSAAYYVTNPKSADDIGLSIKTLYEQITNTPNAKEDRAKYGLALDDIEEALCVLLAHMKFVSELETEVMDKIYEKWFETEF
jgi:hypothetical protein